MTDWNALRVAKDGDSELIGRVIRSVNAKHVPPERIFSLAIGAHGETLVIKGSYSRRRQSWNYNVISVSGLREMIDVGFWKVVSR